MGGRGWLGRVVVVSAAWVVGSLGGCAGAETADGGTTSAPSVTAQPSSSGAPRVGGAADVARGARLFVALGCGACHGPGKSAGPPLEGLFGSAVALEGGGRATVDEAYLRESIVAPAAKLREGQRPVMPSYQGKLSDEDLQDLVAHLKTL